VRRYRLKFDDDPILDHNVEPIAAIELNTLIYN
jgi:hypothetical protein